VAPEQEEALPKAEEAVEAHMLLELREPLTVEMVLLDELHLAGAKK
jgi:hypothetical protein